MKAIFLLFTLNLLVSKSHATGYYVAANGNNNNSGTSKTTPFQTIAAFNTLVLQPGDNIFFRRGDVFRGQLTIRYSGTASSPIVITSYGTGVRPIIAGSEVVTNFSLFGTNIYSASFGSNPVTVFSSGNVNFPARFPNSGYFTIDNSSNGQSFYDAALTQASGYWNGATVHNRIWPWQFVENKVQSFIAGTVTLQTPTTMTDFKAGWGYYLSDKLELLDTSGEFYYNTTQQKLYVYAKTKPNNTTVEASVYNFGIFLQSAANVTITNINFMYQKGSGISSTDNNTNVTITTCRFSNIYGKAISLNAVNNVVIKNNDLLDIYSKGMVVDESENVTVQGNTLKRIGLYAGRATEKSAQQISYNGMEIEGEIRNGNISLNTLDSIGYNGIRFSVHTLIEKNIISNYCLSSNDGGGLYTFTGTGTFSEIRGTGCMLKNNIIQNGIGNVDGTVRVSPSANGIYMDDASGGTVIFANTMNNIAAAGIFLHNSHNDTLQNNVIFNCLNTCLRITKDGIVSVPIVNSVINNNIFYMLKKDLFNLSLINYVDTSFNFAAFSGNYYNNPYSDAVISVYKFPQTYSPDSQLIYSVKQWKTLLNKDNTAKDSYVRWNDYKVTDTIGPNLINNGMFNTDKNYWYCYNQSATCMSQWDPANIKLNGGSLHVQCNDGVTYNTYSFALKSNQKYQLSFSSNAVKDENIVVRTNENSGYYETLDFVRTFSADTGRHENVVTFNSSYSSSPARMNFYTTKNASDFWIDNVNLYNVNAVYDDPLGRNLLYINTTNTNQTFSLPQTLYNLNNNPVSGSITLAPFTSQILIKKDGASSTFFETKAITFNPGKTKSKLYPNPARDFLIIDDTNLAKQINIFDVSGKLVLQVSNKGANMHVLNISKLSSGIYFLISGTTRTMFLKQ